MLINLLQRMTSILVATLPSHGKRGICTALMNVAHEYFKEREYRFPFLSTMPTLTAYGLYHKLGYEDVTEFPSAYKIVQDYNTKAYIRTHEKNAREELNLDTILRIYNEFSKTKTGLVIRDKEYLKILMRIEGVTARNCIVGEEGYVIFKRDKNGTPATIISDSKITEGKHPRLYSTRHTVNSTNVFYIFIHISSWQIPHTDKTNHMPFL